MVCVGRPVWEDNRQVLERVRSELEHSDCDTVQVVRDVGMELLDVGYAPYEIVVVVPGAQFEELLREPYAVEQVPYDHSAATFMCKSIPFTLHMGDEIEGRIIGETQ